MRDFAHRFVSAAFFDFLFLPIAYSKDAHIDFSQNTSKDVVPRKNVPFGVAKPVPKI